LNFHKDELLQLFKTRHKEIQAETPSFYLYLNFIPRRGVSEALNFSSDSQKL
jgi:hypothetical protein